MPHPKRTFLIALFILLSMSRKVLAAPSSPVIRPIIWVTIPGSFLISNPAFALTTSLMAAILEIPFFQWAGIQKGALWISLRANFLSTFVGFAMIFSAIVLFFLGAVVPKAVLVVLGLIYAISVVAVPIWAEIWYARRYARADAHIAFPLILANMISSILISVVSFHLGLVFRKRPFLIEPYLTILYWSATLVLLVVFLGSFFVKVPKMSMQPLKTSEVAQHPESTTASQLRAQSQRAEIADSDTEPSL